MKLPENVIQRRDKNTIDFDERDMDIVCGGILQQPADVNIGVLYEGSANEKQDEGRIDLPICNIANG